MGMNGIEVGITTPEQHMAGMDRRPGVAMQSLPRFAVLFDQHADYAIDPFAIFRQHNAVVGGQVSPPAQQTAGAAEEMSDCLANRTAAFYNGVDQLGKQIGAMNARALLSGLSGDEQLKVLRQFANPGTTDCFIPNPKLEDYT